MENAKDILKSKSIILNDLVSSVTQLCPTFCNPMDCSTPGFAVHHQLPVLTHSCPLRRWCQPTISSSVIPFSSRLQSFPASGSFPVSRLFPSGSQSIGGSASAVSPSNEYTGLISFRIDWCDPLAVQGTLKSFHQHYHSKASVLWYLAFFVVQLSPPCMNARLWF